MARLRLTKKEKERIQLILQKLDEEYGIEIRCFLNYETPWQLLIATILSAQCTDDRVNIVTATLFKKYPTIEAFANADILEMEKDIHSTGFYRNKARNIIECTRRLMLEYGGEVPRDIDELTGLAGVGRKTANVIRGNIYNEPSIVVDTHVRRVSNRLGFTEEQDPVKIEFELMRIIPKDHWILYNIQIITLGRSLCTARSPKCMECFLNPYCKQVMVPVKKS